MPLPSYVKLVAACALPNFGGISSAAITSSQLSSTWYKTLKKPCWTPPVRVFGPVWTTLYTGMGYASYLVWRDGGGFEGKAKWPLALYGTNLALNWAWTAIFFGQHKIGMALADSILLIGVVGSCIWQFWPINQVASYMMVPYMGWMFLALSINYRIWKDNKEEDTE